MTSFHSQVPNPTPEGMPFVTELFWSSFAPWIFGVLIIGSIVVFACERVWKKDDTSRVRPSLLTGAWGVVGFGWFASVVLAVFMSV
ncbi:hypothetical protein Rhow_004622 [Rhodococcus wratislaviensis]|uniref:Uncharacterized protein n=1 Tax=Rhodococcus wratislaviensis TaxID=44752 RepID=A0A402CBK3_RHOWR|nr:hypothetical protein [Rhodococcus wratislaviensis]GCE40979.1 hypothetical protein Rhow_004622 [Rhodococcus wratislaviensis]